MTQVMQKRLTLFIAMSFYGYSIFIGLQYYLAEEHWFWGFAPPTLTLEGWFFCLFAIMLISLFLPINIKKPSSLVLITLCFVVIMPILVLTIFNYENSIARYGSTLGLLITGFIFSCFLCSRVTKPSAENKIPSGNVAIVFFAIAVCMAVLLVYEYASIMAFAGLEQTYEQRKLGAASSGFIGYIQVYLAYFFCPGLLAIGLSRKNIILTVFSVAGFVLSYSITAERTVFLLPIIMIGIYVLYNYKKRISYISLVFFVSLIIILVSVFYESSSIVNGIALYFVYRVIALPGILFSQYLDFFGEQGLTYWTHVRGFDLVIDVPVVYQHNPLFPYLGRILADEFLGVDSNSNANLFAYDGAAALGVLGVLIICLLLTLWLLVLDYAANKWSPAFVLPVVFPMAYALTNGSFFTVLLSFGGIFWIILFFLMPESRRFSAFPYKKANMA